MTWWCLLAPSMGRVSRTWATTIPSRPSPTRSIDTTGVPRSLSTSPSATGSPENGAKSRNQESRTFIVGLLELREEAGVVGEEEPQVVDAVAGHGQAVDAEAEGRSEEHTSELQSLMRITYAVFCLKKITTRMT